MRKQKKIALKVSDRRAIYLRLPDWIYDWVMAETERNRRKYPQEEIIEILRRQALGQDSPGQESPATSG